MRKAKHWILRRQLGSSTSCVRIGPDSESKACFGFGCVGLRPKPALDSSDWQHNRQFQNSIISVEDNMLEWLNNNIGSDVATYIGVLLAVIGLVYSAKKIIHQKTQVQNVKNGNGIQAGRDIHYNKKD
jgi:hypothetical protein